MKMPHLPRLLMSLLLAVAAGTATAAKPAPDLHPQVLLKTSLGDITVELDAEHAPLSVANFLIYVKEGHYDGTIFHRVIPGFVAQGGGYDAKYVERPTHGPIKLESGNGLSNAHGTLAMAREGAPNTATAQFFFNLVDNTRLDGPAGDKQPQTGYAVFGKVVAGMDVMDHMAEQATGRGGPFPSDVPQTSIVLLKAKLLPRAKAGTSS
jgi:peptidyl-prolyl cis-trans isomerase B (cyclophilin B)